MCGRFAISLPPDSMARLFEAAPDNDLPAVPNYNVCPTDEICVVSLGEDRRRLTSMRWGFLPRWAKSESEGPPLINARGETLAESRAFGDAARFRRCLIPATGFYEWTEGPDGKSPWFVRPADGTILALAAIWQTWRDRTTCAIVTCAAAGPMAAIHPRMPVGIPIRDWPLWSGEAGLGASRLIAPIENGLSIHRVAPAVNGIRATGAELIRPIEGGS